MGGVEYEQFYRYLFGTDKIQLAARQVQTRAAMLHGTVKQKYAY